MDNFDLRKYLAEGRLFEKVETKNFNLGSAKMDIETDEDGAMAYLKGKSGNYDGIVEDGKVSFSVSYDDREDDIDDFYNENNIEEFIGKDHAFMELSKRFDHDWDIGPDYVEIEIKL